MHRFLLALTAAAFATPALAGTLIDNVHGLQVGADGQVERFSALLVGDDGKVEAVWSAGPKPHADRVVDGAGRTMLPGLIDAHGHVMGLGRSALQLDLVGTQSVQELQARLRSYAAKPGSAWIVGRGWNQELWPDKRFPTAADLDAIVRERPVVLERVDGHAVVANSAALRLAGITRATADPSGGKIERDAQGNATGLLIDSAADLVSAKVPPQTPLQLSEALAEAQRILLSHGITATTDMGTSAGDWTAMRRAAADGRLQVRVMAYASALEPLKQLGLTQPTGWLHGDRLRLGGVKLYADGALGSRGAWLKRSYADAPTRGLQFLSDAELQAQADAAARGGFQLAVHAIGDAANAQVIGAFERLKARYPGDRRFRIEHFQIADPADIPRLARSRIIASMQPVHQTSDRLMAEKRLDPPRLAGAYAWATVLRSGARIAFGSDYPVESPNPFPGLAAAISRQDPNGQPPGGWRPEERVSFAQALSGLTRDAAYAGFAEGRIGSLEPGKWADFILVDRDPTAGSPQDLAGTQVLETWVAGTRVWSRDPAGAKGERGR